MYICIYSFMYIYTYISTCMCIYMKHIYEAMYIYEAMHVCVYI